MFALNITSILVCAEQDFGTWLQEFVLIKPQKLKSNALLTTRVPVHPTIVRWAWREGAYNSVDISSVCRYKVSCSHIFVFSYTTKYMTNKIKSKAHKS